MIQSRRRRRYHNQTFPSQRSFHLPGNLLGAVILVVVVVWGVGKVFNAISPGVDGRRVATILQVDGRGTTQVTIRGENTPQRAETGLRLYDGDRISTDGAAYARLRFFDETLISLDRDTQITLDDVLKGEELSQITLTLERGDMWVYSGTGTDVTRVVTTNRGTFAIPPRTMAIIGSDVVENNIYVFESSGPGVQMAYRGGGVVIGEGQELHVSSSDLENMREGVLDPYEKRTALNSNIFDAEFYVQNMQNQNEEEERKIEIAVEKSKETTVDGELLVVDSPDDGVLLDGNTVLVKGRVGSRVENVRVNGYVAVLLNGAFEREIALPDEEEFSVDVQAEDKNGLLVAEKSLLLLHDIKPPESPTIIFPAEAGSEVQVSEDEFEIIGQAAKDTAGIIVNGYQLQKFKPGGQWKYLVDPAIGNVRIGENTYEVVAVDRSGNHSKPVSITILWKAQPLPAQEDPEFSGGIHAYLSQGSLRVIAPTTGETYVTNSSEVLIEGETHADTHSISINGFNLTKYLPGKTTWNYIAKEAFNNYHDGVNRYTVVARNGEGKILDVIQYVMEKRY